LCKSACIYALARALVIVAKNQVISPKVQLAHKYGLIYASGIQALLTAHNPIKIQLPNPEFWKALKF
jgi:hypothetical protein